MSEDRPRIGRLYGIGIGPGDPELVTLKAYRILMRVPVIFVPKKAHESEGFAKAVISSLVTSSESKIVELLFPMLTDRKLLAKSWHEAVETIWQYLAAGDDGAFVSLGDPLLYGTLVHVLDTLGEDHPQVPVEVIPGISSVSAAAARAMVPLAINDESLAIVSSLSEPGFIKEVLQGFNTVVFMKVNRASERLFSILEELDLTAKCVYVKSCTTKDEELVRDITRLKGCKLDYFSLLIVRR